MSGSRFIFRSGIFVFVLLSVVMFSCPVSAGPFQYSAQSWDDAPPVSDSKAPEPIGFWQVSPMVLVAVMLVVISPALVLPAEILIAGLSMVALNFRRVEEKTVLDHDLRGRIYRYIVENPGVCFTGIERGLDVNRGTLDYHLKILGREHRISVFTRNRRILL